MDASKHTRLVGGIIVFEDADREETGKIDQKAGLSHQFFCDYRNIQKCLIDKHFWGARETVNTALAEDHI